MFELKSPAHAGLFLPVSTSNEQGVVAKPASTLKSTAEQEIDLYEMTDFERRLPVSRLR